MTWTGKVQTVAITILVIAMGARMGANREVTENLGDIGVSALIMTAGVMGCTILALFLVRKVIGIDRYGIMHRKSAAGTEDDPEQAEKAAEAAVEKIEEDEKKTGRELHDPHYSRICGDRYANRLFCHKGRVRGQYCGF